MCEVVCSSLHLIESTMLQDYFNVVFSGIDEKYTASLWMSSRAIVPHRNRIAEETYKLPYENAYWALVENTDALGNQTRDKDLNETDQ